jgi:hypothetical protein
MPASQSQAGIDRVNQDGKNTRILYYGSGILLLIGGLAFALPNHLISNLDASIIFLLGIIAFGSIRYIQASEKVMGVVLPIAIVTGGSYIGYTYVKKKRIHDGNSLDTDLKFE